MMKLRILLLNLLVVYTIHFMAQESYSNDVTCVKADDNIAVITASGTAEKKKDVYNICLLYTSPSPRDTERSRMPSSA